MPEKVYVDAQSFIRDSFQLGVDIIKSGFHPTILIAVWRGGTPVGIAVQELLSYAGIHTDHIAIRTSSYSSDIDTRKDSIRIHGMDYIYKRIESHDRLLIVDDVFDTGLTIKALKEDIEIQARRNAPEEIRVAVPYYKPSRRVTEFEPDYYIHETERWLKFPHSLEGLTPEEIQQHRPELFKIVHPERVTTVQ